MIDDLEKDLQRELEMLRNSRDLPSALKVKLVKECEKDLRRVRKDMKTDSYSY